MVGLVLALLVVTGWFALPGRALARFRRDVKVTNTNDSGLVSFKAVIDRANTNLGQDSASVSNAEDNEANNEPLVGMWDVTVSGFATYYYTYSISPGAFVATGNIDNNWDGAGSSFGPTMGSYVRAGRRAYRIREKAWSFDPQGNPAGHSVFVGTYTVDKKGKTLIGKGTYTLYDLAGNAIFVESLTVTGTKVGV